MGRWFEPSRAHSRYRRRLFEWCSDIYSLELSSIQNLVFDFGGVILDLYPERTHSAFATIGGISQAKARDLVLSSPFFDQYEKGLMSDNEFREAIRDLLGRRLSDEQIDEAWNAMLGDIPLERLELLRKLRGTYRLFLLSNTNDIHLRSFTKTVNKVSGEENLGAFFDEAFYSHLLKMRKPDGEIFDHVLLKHGLNPSETLFLDDNTYNIEAAGKAGMQTFHVLKPAQWMALFV